MRTEDHPTVKWLLESSRPAVRYRTLIGLLGRRADDAEVDRTARQLGRDPDVKLVAAWLKGKKPTGSQVLLSLNYLGEVAAPDLAKLIAPTVRAWFLDRWQPDGRVRDFAKGRAQMLPPCHAGQVMRGLIRLGLLTGEQIAQAVSWFKRSVRHDGGWFHVARDDGQTPSCPFPTFATLAALLAARDVLGEDGETTRLIEKSSAFLLSHWRTRKPIPYQDRGKKGGFGIGTTFAKPIFPTMHTYGILGYAARLSDHAPNLARPELKQVMAALAQRADPTWRYRCERAAPSLKGFEFGQTKTPSKWATLSAITTLARFHGDTGFLAGPPPRPE